MVITSRCAVGGFLACLACVLGASFLLTGLWQAGYAASPAGDARKGKPIFMKYCAGCHGPTGQGDGYRLLGPSPADLTALSEERADAELLKTIHDGKPNMPAWRARFTDEESRDVLAYVRTLAGPRP
jgi:mono/diheme cytochrome c family protein